MFRHSLVAVAIGAALVNTLPAAVAATNADVAQLRAEFEQKLKTLKDDYETRLKEMEARLEKTEARAEESKTESPAATPATPVAAQNAFNPEISLILQGNYARRLGGERHITGFLQGGHDHGSERGLSLDHTELTLGASVDPYFRGYANIALADGEAEVEEAWFQTLSLGKGFSLKGGRFLSGIGYQNEQHPHAWDFADNNFMYQVLFGEHFAQDGLQAKWLAPTPMFLEFGLEAGRGQNFPGSEEGGDKNGPGTWAAFAHVGDDLGIEQSWRAGLSYVYASPKARSSHIEDLNDVEALTDFTGTSKTWIADLVWKWAPDGNPRDRYFKFQSEYFYRIEDGDLLCEDNSLEGGACDGTTGLYRSRQSGWYAQGVYQFMPRWRIGLRYDRLDSGSLNFGANNVFLPRSDYQPDKWSLMADYSPSEFSRFRLQWARDHSMEGRPDDNQITLQYILSLGAHGAHKF